MDLVILWKKMRMKEMAWNTLGLYIHEDIPDEEIVMLISRGTRLSGYVSVRIKREDTHYEVVACDKDHQKILITSVPLDHVDNVHENLLSSCKQFHGALLASD